MPNNDAAICWSATGERTVITYSELYTKSTLFAKGLLTLGFAKQSIVAIESKNTVEWLISTFGTQMAGFVPLHFSFAKESGEDVVAILNSVKQCVALIADFSSINICQKIAGNLVRGNICSFAIPTLQNVILMKSSDGNLLDTCALIDLGISLHSLLPNIYADDICAIFLTSGSTGLAKAVPFTHRKLCVMGFTYYKLFELEPGDKLLSYLPFGWLGCYPIGTLTHGATVVTYTDIRKIKSVQEINSMTVTVLNADKCVSALLLSSAIFDLVKQKDIICNSFPLRVVCTVGLPIDSICSKILEQKAKKFAVGYGCTEMGLICTITVSSSDEYESFAVGKPIPGTEVKILDDNGQIVPRGTSGELYVRMRDRFLGYLNAKEKSDICSDQTGWYKTDDIGVMKLDGSVVVTGRKSDMMIISGELVSPSYLEGILKEHEAVANAIVLPMHNLETFQQACAAVVLQKGKSATEEELKSFVREQRGKYAESFLATRYVPKIVLFFDSFPATHSGKIDRKAIAEAIRKRTES